MEMVEARVEEEERQQEAEYWRTAWQTALLMNATGNFKTRITPEKLLGKDFGKKQKQPKAVSKQKQAEEVARLEKLFGKLHTDS